MRKIPVRPLNSDKWYQWVAECQKATEANIEAVKLGKKVTIEPKLYRHKDIKDTYFFNNCAPFFGRCAYCECPIKDFQHGDIEHFRPKAGVTDELGQKIYRKDGQGNTVFDSKGKAKLHLGYYWLGYDWHNLIPACTKCNVKTKNGNFGKHTRFPVVGHHAQEPGDEMHEKPLLINPASGKASDDPENHLFVEPETGRMGFRTDNGDMCIKIFGLNIRTQLVNARKDKCDAVEYRIVKFQNLFKDLHEPKKSKKDTWEKLLSCLDDFIDLWNGQEAYTMAARDTLRQQYSIEWIQETRQEIQEILAKVEFGGTIAQQND